MQYQWAVFRSCGGCWGLTRCCLLFEELSMWQWPVPRSITVGVPLVLAWEMDLVLRNFVVLVDGWFRVLLWSAEEEWSRLLGLASCGSLTVIVTRTKVTTKCELLQKAGAQWRQYYLPSFGLRIQNSKYIFCWGYCGGQAERNEIQTK